MERPTSRPPTGRLLDAWMGANQALARHVTPLIERDCGVGFKDFMLLDAIAEGARYPGEIVERLGFPPSHVSRVLDDLDHRGLVTRALDPQDSRRVRLALTDTGQQAHTAARDLMTHLIEAALEGLPDGEVDALTRAMRELHGTLLRAAELCPHLRAPQAEEVSS
ncbi:MAG TPA: MarR family winged helix-turn-helix transcriptional regulator [Deinococcales bacterium]|nr:MarR family winged helix-turn-helix transcriptional regulator [Deinococcales bacterium]